MNTSLILLSADDNMVRFDKKNPNEILLPCLRVKNPAEIKKYFHIAKHFDTLKILNNSYGLLILNNKHEFKSDAVKEKFFHYEKSIIYQSLINKELVWIWEGTYKLI